MGGNIRSSELVNRLDAEHRLAAKGFAVSCGPTGGVVIDRDGHVHGVWHFVKGNFFWTPAGYNEPIYKTASIEEAVSYTMETAPVSREEVDAVLQKADELRKKADAPVPPPKP